MDAFAEMHLQPEPLFHLPSDNVAIMCMEGTPEGRIFLGGKDGSLYEVIYQPKDGWFSKRCQLVNLSTSKLAFLLPSFLSFTEEGMDATGRLSAWDMCMYVCVCVHVCVFVCA